MNETTKRLRFIFGSSYSNRCGIVSAIRRYMKNPNQYAVNDQEHIDLACTRWLDGWLGGVSSRSRFKREFIVAAFDGLRDDAEWYLIFDKTGKYLWDSEVEELERLLEIEAIHDK